MIDFIKGNRRKYPTQKNNLSPLENAGHQLFDVALIKIGHDTNKYTQFIDPYGQYY